MQRLPPVSLVLKPGIHSSRQAARSQSRGWTCLRRKEPKFLNWLLFREVRGVWGGAQGPSQQQEQKPSTCSVAGARGPACLTPPPIFPFTLHCPGASITFLTQSPGMGIAALQKFPEPVTHLSVQPPHTLTTRHTSREVGGHPLASELV